MNEECVTTSDIAAYLQALKDKNGWTIREWAERSGVPEGSISRVLTAQNDQPRFANLAALVKSAGGSLDELAGIAPTVVTHETVIESPRSMHYYDLQSTAFEEMRRTIHHQRLSCYIAWGIDVLLLVAIGGLVIYDILNTSVGWVRSQFPGLSQLFKSVIG